MNFWGNGRCETTISLFYIHKYGSRYTTISILMQISFKNNFYQKRPVKNKHKRFHYYKKDGKWKPKLKFDTYRAAENYLTTRNKLEEYNIYRCPYCGKFHIGHLGKKPKKESE